MKFSFLNKQFPVITGIFAGQTPQELIAEARHTEYEGGQGVCIDLFDLKPEFRNYDGLKSIIDAINLPTMFYFYRNDKWGNPTEEERQELLLTAAEAGASMIDVMGDVYDPSPMEITHNPEAIDKQKKLIDKIHSIGSQVVMSSHMPTMARSTEQVLEHMLEVEKRGADVVKIVTGAFTEDDLAEAVKTTITLKKELKTPFIHLCNGPYGRPHRYFGPTLGLAICFAVPRYEPRYGMHQPTVRAMKTAIENMHWNISDVMQ